jgi:ribosomal-protein-alanine N-acetyltransferase
VDKVEIRDATGADLPAIAELERASFPAPWPAPSLAAELARPGAVALAADRDGTVAGFALFLVAGDEAELLRIAVDPAGRRRGVGRRLVAAGLRRLRGRGVAVCHLELRADDPGADSFYRALGFELAGRRRRYYRDRCDALLLRRRLGPGGGPDSGDPGPA